MNTTNVTKGYEFGSAMNEPYIVTPMKPNTPISNLIIFQEAPIMKEWREMPFPMKYLNKWPQ